MKKVAVPIFLLFTVFAFAHDAGYEHLHCVMHVHTTVSGGKYTFEKISDLAKQKGIDVVIFADHDIMRWEYGVFPFRKLYKKSFEMPSVFQYGIEKYLQRIKEAGERNPDIILFPGVETAPYYYWTGGIFKNNLAINNWHKHMLVMGLENAEDYKNLPSNSNPYVKTKYSQYDDDFLSEPYQDMIDYVNSKGGLCFWAHPEVQWTNMVHNIPVITKAHPEDLVETRDYTGFAALVEGCKEITKPGNYWDKLLADYCHGRRNNLIWAIGELDYKEEREGMNINTVQNVLKVREKTKEECLSALKNGSFYALVVGKKAPLYLNEFSVRLIDNTSVVIRIKIGSEDKRNAMIRLIGDGELIRIFDKEVPVDFEYKHRIDKSSPSTNKKIYYRLDIGSVDGAKIISNPIFLRLNENN